MGSVLDEMSARGRRLSLFAHKKGSLPVECRIIRAPATDMIKVSEY